MDNTIQDKLNTLKQCKSDIREKVNEICGGEPKISTDTYFTAYSDSMNLINTIKANLRNALNEKLGSDITTTTPFSEYVDAITEYNPQPEELVQVSVVANTGVSVALTPSDGKVTPNSIISAVYTLDSSGYTFTNWVPTPLHQDNTTRTAFFRVTDDMNIMANVVKLHCDSIELSETEVTIAENGTHKITVTTIPNNTIDEIIAQSDNESVVVATVNKKNITLQWKSEGTTFITVSCGSAEVKYIEVTCKAALDVVCYYHSVSEDSYEELHDIGKYSTSTSLDFSIEKEDFNMFTAIITKSRQTPSLTYVSPEQGPVDAEWEDGMSLVEEGLEIPEGYEMVSYFKVPDITDNTYAEITINE